MFCVNSCKKKRQLQGEKNGFTLVELLIVVAIIGVLATVGIPTYKKMMQKSRKAEAKVALGALYAAEVGFFAEFAVYTNSLLKIGFEMAGWEKSLRFGGIGVHPGIYSIGFPQNFCVANMFIMPSMGPGRQAIESIYPDFYAGIIGVYVNYLVENAPPPYGWCLPKVLDPLGLVYLATASAVIAPGVDPNTRDPTLVDQWSIDQNRSLVNVVDGVQ